MKCQDKKCRKGKIDFSKKTLLSTGCGGCGGHLALSYPCDVCGRLHWSDGTPVQNRQGHRAFLKNGVLVNIDSKGVEHAL